LSDLGILWPNLLWHIVNFLVMLFLLSRLVYSPVLQLFAKRRERIRVGLAEAERVREEAAQQRSRLEAQIADERRQGQERVRKAVEQSEAAANRRRAEAEAEADGILARARAEAEEVRREALAGLQGEIADLTVRAASKVLESEIDEGRHRALIERFISDELGAMA